MGDLIKMRFIHSATLSFAVILVITGCAGKATSPVDVMGTTVAQLASDILTGTASASSRTPTVTLTLQATDTPTETPTSPPIHLPQVANFAGCWYGPGPTYTLESNISKGKRVELLGVGNVPGWYIIRNPYFHQPCWIAASDLQVDSRIDTTKYAIMTPGHP